MVNKQNIILITVDSLRADHVGILNEKLDIETPNINSLADGEINCKNAFACGPYTRASFPSILTGTYAWYSNNYTDFTLDDRPHIAEQFSQGGYDTGAFHSNGFLSEGSDYERGFDVFQDNQSTTTVNKIESIVESAPLDSITIPLGEFVYNKISNISDQIGGGDGGYGVPYTLADELNDQTIDWIRSAEEPFFCWIHYMDVHVPNYPRENTVSESLSADHAYEINKKSGENDPSDLSDRELEDFRTLYKGEIEYLDEQIGKLLEQIYDHFDAESIELAFFSDHGESLGEHNHLRHGDRFHAGVTRVPFFITSPDIEVVFEAPVSGINIMPTLLEYGDIAVPEQCRGKSIKTIIEDSPKERFVYTQSGHSDSGSVMVTDGNWQLVADTSLNSRKAFRLSEGESHAISCDQVPDDRLSRLEDSLSSHIQSFHTDNNLEESSDIPENVKKQLEELGYKDV